jgi:hypothetical protein
MSQLQTLFPKAAISVAKINASSSIEMMEHSLGTAIGNLNIVMNKKDLRESLDMDEQINIGVARVMLMDIEKKLEEVKALLKESE